MKGTFTFATGRYQAIQHQLDGVHVEEIGEERFTVTIPVEYNTIADVEGILASVDDDVDTFTIKDADGNDLWTEEDFE